MNFDNLFKVRKPAPLRPKQWRVTFYREDGTSIACTGLYKSKKEAIKAMDTEGGKNLTPVY